VTGRCSGPRVSTPSRIRQHNADIGEQLLDAIIHRRGLLDLRDGARRLARLWSRDRGSAIQDSFVFTSFARRGWMVPNQYWTPGILSPMAIMGKYYQYYGNDFLPPRILDGSASL
jgi:glyceraldehyde-3-phosphate dehydrogenase (ferredoxin)